MGKPWARTGLPNHLKRIAVAAPVREGPANSRQDPRDPLHQKASVMKSPAKIEFGDFQTPQDTAASVCRFLADFGIAPKTIIEPTCGLGSFVEAAATAFPKARRILGFEINKDYVLSASKRLALADSIPRGSRIEVRQGDFFHLDWQQVVSSADAPCCSSEILRGSPIRPWAPSRAKICPGKATSKD